MAEKSKGVQNLWLLAIAIVLGMLAVVIYNVHISAIRNENKQKRIEVIKVTKALKIGANLKDNIMERAIIYTDDEGAADHYVAHDRRPALISGKGQTVYLPIQKGEFLMEHHITSRQSGGAASAISPDLPTNTINIDDSPGQLLEPGGFVNIKGLFQIKETGRYETVRILENIRVVGVGGKRLEASTMAAARNAGRAMTNFRTITVELPPELSLQLDNLKTHCIGNFTVEVLAQPKENAKKPSVNHKLKSMALSAKPPSR
ncbi:MAG: hypothetical protein HN909_07945 [Phycisphaerales bacterium]|jgi:Flp pilus assembly protein CpaB|nr:hypothetical protein [Phycisphaerales bacterium]MBT7171687.1 hypothetical protein [Phycisphaerales bacterium]